VLAALSWGAAVAAPLSAALSDRFVLGPVAAAPVVEELTKAAGLALLGLVRPPLVAGPVAGMILGAIVGLGFTAAENVAYLTLAAVQGGGGGLARAVYLRAALQGFHHALFSATAGAGMGAAWTVRTPALRGAAVAAGLGAAVAQHLAWNGLAAVAIAEALCDPALPGGPCRIEPHPVTLLVLAPLVVAAALAPGSVALLLVVRATQPPTARAR
jgi:RsiW-degrading membrane proteinase PrsW (M82 family)